jgi:hypothetical protein
VGSEAASDFPRVAVTGIAGANRSEKAWGGYTGDGGEEREEDERAMATSMEDGEEEKTE